MPQRVNTSLECRKFLLDPITPGGKFLDIGCGNGNMMEELIRRGCDMSGIDFDPHEVQTCRDRGLNVVQGRAEALPFESQSFDGIICSVVIPLVDERRAVAEWARVLKPGGFVRATYHGIGFGIHYLCCGSHWKQRFYGWRMLVNTAWYQVAGRRIPGFFGDTLCQLPSSLRRQYRKLGFSLVNEVIVSRFAGAPQYFGHQLLKNVPPDG